MATVPRVVAKLKTARSQETDPAKIAALSEKIILAPKVAKASQAESNRVSRNQYHAAVEPKLLEFVAAARTHIERTRAEARKAEEKFFRASDLPWERTGLTRRVTAQAQDVAALEEAIDVIRNRPLGTPALGTISSFFS